MLKGQCQKLLINRKCPNPLMFLQGDKHSTGRQKSTQKHNSFTLMTHRFSFSYKMPYKN